MELQEYKFIISPENIKSDLVFVPYTGETDITTIIDPCCLTATTISATTTGTTGVYLPMDYILSGNTGGTSFLTGLSVNIMLTESAVDLTVGSVRASFKRSAGDQGRKPQASPGSERQRFFFG